MIAFIFCAADSVLVNKTKTESRHTLHSLSEIFAVIARFEYVAPVLIKFCAGVLLVQPCNGGNVELFCYSGGNRSASKPVTPCIESRPCDKEIRRVFLDDRYDFRHGCLYVLGYVIVSAYDSRDDFPASFEINLQSLSRPDCLLFHNDSHSGSVSPPNPP